MAEYITCSCESWAYFGNGAWQTTMADYTGEWPDGLDPVTSVSVPPTDAFRCDQCGDWLKGNGEVIKDETD